MKGEVTNVQSLLTKARQEADGERDEEVMRLRGHLWITIIASGITVFRLTAKV